MLVSGQDRALNYTLSPDRARISVFTGPVILKRVFSSAPNPVPSSLDLGHSSDFTAAQVLNLKGWNTLSPTSYKLLFGDTSLVYNSQVLSWWGIQKEPSKFSWENTL